MRNEINALRALATVAMRVVSQYDAKTRNGLARADGSPCHAVVVARRVTQLGAGARSARAYCHEVDQARDRGGVRGFPRGV